jgi:hypothetical protein
VLTPSGNGYWTIESDGNLANFGDAVVLSSSQPVTDPILGAVRTPSGAGLWLFSASGSIYRFGDAKDLGSLSSTKLNKPIVGMAGTRRAVMGTGSLRPMVASSPTGTLRSSDRPGR